MKALPDSERCFFCRNRHAWDIAVGHAHWRVCGVHLPIGANNGTAESVRLGLPALLSRIGKAK